MCMDQLKENLLILIECFCDFAERIVAYVLDVDEDEEDTIGKLLSCQTIMSH